ncbi:hypothetical protein [Staphylococcus nepalensis]|jgi:hypothetical protein|uniref:Uncharacterized protein n=1 Tax=Staphylococcus nepalensis TaxID=214473 RepID=A0A380GHK5_9STAP|nr:hypothetical protein [Staphylococcus nepalensis]PNZ95657.1 hypothetical protein CD130_11965 [Staphylococcus nepalensis]GGB94261.1 hypothetical protein GCM10007203_26660 [Staphylococcus nepalensis]SUM53931.1 Uncharacterised protein [Staphylococcus nepalensis]VDG65861.1 Uncharacterised protein [Lacrimispora indolis]
MNKNIDEPNLEQINKQIEEELKQYDAKAEEKKVKKEFLTLKFLGTFIILVIMIFSIAKLFV